MFNAKDNKEIVLVAQKLRADKEVVLACSTTGWMELGDATEELYT